MLKINYLKLFLFAAVLAIGVVSCEEDPKETCYFDEICTGVDEVTYCCTDDVCVYKYNGKEYTEDQEDELIADLGCGVAIGLKSAGTDADISYLKAKLHALVDKVRKEHQTK